MAAHVDHNGIFMVQHAGCVNRPDVFYTADALLHLTRKQHDYNAGQCHDQQGMITGKFA